MRLGLSMRLRATAPTAGGAGDAAGGRAAAGSGAPRIGCSGGTWGVQAPCLGGTWGVHVL